MLCIRTFKFQADSRVCKIGREDAVHRFDNTVKEHLLNPNVVVKILEVANGRQSAARVQMDRRGRVS